MSVVDVVVVYQNAGAPTGVQLPAPGLGGGVVFRIGFQFEDCPFLHLNLDPKFYSFPPHIDQDLTILFFI